MLPKPLVDWKGGHPSLLSSRSVRRLDLAAYGTSLATEVSAYTLTLRHDAIAFKWISKQVRILIHVAINQQLPCAAALKPKCLQTINISLKSSD